MAHAKSAHFPSSALIRDPQMLSLLAPSSLRAEWKWVQADLYSIPFVMWQGQAEPTWSGEATGLGDSRVGALPPRFTGSGQSLREEVSTCDPFRGHAQDPTLLGLPCS